MRVPGWSVLALLTAPLACSQPPSGPATPEQGQAYYQALNCAACHRIGGSGGDTGPDLSYVGFRHSAAWLDQWLKNPQAWQPGTLMPNPRLSDRTRAALVAYLASLKGQEFHGVPPWDAPSEAGQDAVPRGKMIYLKAGCVACHGTDGRGGHHNNNVPGSLIPPLSSVAGSYTLSELERKIRFGSKPAKQDPAGPEPLVSMPAWGQALSPGDIEAVSRYLLSLGGKSKQSGPESGW